MSVKRLLDCTPSDLAAYSKTDLLAAIAGSEGRVLACETIGDAAAAGGRDERRVCGFFECGHSAFEYV